MSWEPQQNYCVCFSDETADPRSKEQLNEMVDRMRAIANEYGFDIQTWGGQDGVFEFLAGVYLK